MCARFFGLCLNMRTRALSVVACDKKNEIMEHSPHNHSSLNCFKWIGSCMYTHGAYRTPGDFFIILCVTSCSCFPINSFSVLRRMKQLLWEMLCLGWFTIIHFFFFSSTDNELFLFFSCSVEFSIHVVIDSKFSIAHLHFFFNFLASKSMWEWKKSFP